MLLLEADIEGEAIFEAAFQPMGENKAIRKAFSAPHSRQQFIKAFSEIWLDYKLTQTQQPFFKDPNSNDIDQAANLMNKTIKMLEEVSSKYPRLRNLNREIIDRLIVDLNAIISQFKSAEIHQPSVGRRFNDPLIARAAAQIVKEFEHITGTKFVFSVDLALGERGKNAFASEHAEFLYRLLYGIDPNIQRSSVATALKRAKQNPLQKKAKK